MQVGKRCILSSHSQTLQAFEEIFSDDMARSDVSCSGHGVFYCAMDNKGLPSP